MYMSNTSYHIIEMDNYYCLIRTKSLNINLYFFSCRFDSTNQYPICLTSNSSNKIYELMKYHNKFLNLSLTHLLYLGRELYKAELAIQIGQLYIQN
uniref:DUF4346 domain-containing protein n=1 Tax=Riquetophycus sp. TaxID=1897556 RepID=A0A1C9C857_9FLOR|nr:hypothetical protein Riqu_072 [Riquetophycus sp.]